MKLVIDIHERDFESLQNGNVTYGIIDAVRNGKPLDAVLDEIKAEFKSKADGDDWYHTTDGLVWEEAIEIIEKHRAESEEV